MPTVKKAPATLEYDVTPLGLDLSDAIKVLKKKYRWLPTAMRVSYYGGFLSPRGMFFPNKAINYEDETLTRGYLWVPPDKKDRWTLQDWALYNGWVKVGWYQSYGRGYVNFSPHIVRRLRLTLYPANGMLEKPEFFLRLLQMVRFYEELFDEQLVYQVHCVNFLNLDDPDLPVGSYIERKRQLFSANAMDLYLQLIRQRKYKEADQFLD